MRVERDGVPDDLAALDEELTRAGRPFDRRVDPGPTALAVSIAMLVLIVALVLPWTGDAAGWEILSGTRTFGLLPRLFTFTSLGFGLVASALALATRWWPLAWLTACGCGIAVINGVWAIWSRQTGVLAGGAGPAIGMIVAVVAVIALAASWARIAGRRD